MTQTAIQELSVCTENSVMAVNILYLENRYGKKEMMIRHHINK